jgi:predicted nucleic acid-binding protein
VILIDTNVLVALANPLDPNNTRATEEFEKLRRDDLRLISPVLVESTHILQHPMLRARLHSAMANLDIVPYRMEDENSLWHECFGWLMKYADQSPDITDAFLVILSHFDRKLKVWTYDSEFWTVWRRPDGSPVPLAVKPRR